MDPSRRSSHRAGGVIGWVVGILAIVALAVILWLVFAPGETTPDETLGGDAPPVEDSRAIDDAEEDADVDAEGVEDPLDSDGEDATPADVEDGDDPSEEDVEDANGNGVAVGNGDAPDAAIEQDIQSIEDEDVDVRTEPDTGDSEDGLQDDAGQDDSPGEAGSEAGASMRVHDGADAMRSPTSDVNEEIQRLERQIAESLGNATEGDAMNP